VQCWPAIAAQLSLAAQKASAHQPAAKAQNVFRVAPALPAELARVDLLLVVSANALEKTWRGLERAAHVLSQEVSTQANSSQTDQIRPCEAAKYIAYDLVHQLAEADAKQVEQYGVSLRVPMTRVLSTGQTSDSAQQRRTNRIWAESCALAIKEINPLTSYKLTANRSIPPFAARTVDMPAIHLQHRGANGWSAQWDRNLFQALPWADFAAHIRASFQNPTVEPPRRFRPAPSAGAQDKSNTADAGNRLVEPTNTPQRRKRSADQALPHCAPTKKQRTSTLRHVINARDLP
jgi:hypothetical protein